MAREKNERQRLFVDMDGTLGVFTPVDEMETLYEKGYFENIKPHENVVGGINHIIDNRPDIEVYILSAYLTDSDYALAEKNLWLDRHLPNIDAEHRVFVPCGSNKRDFLPDGIRNNDYLLDDYTANLNSWLPARGIKLLNGINHTRGTWEYDRISYNKPAPVLSDDICAVMTGEKHIFDDRPINVSDPYRATLVVNLYAGAGAGKTTCAWLIAGELKKRNIVTEYVSEYAKELVWDNNTALLNGSYDNQLSVLSEQYRRIHRLIGKVDVVVTDSPLLLSGMYVKENHDKFNAVVLSMYNECDNFNLFINRGEYYEQAGRIHSLEQSVEIDNNIKAFLDNNNVYFGTYHHGTLNIVVNNIQTSLERLQRGIAPNTRASERGVALENNDFQERVIAAQDMRDEARGYGLRLNVNGDGTITFYHGTSKNNANLIQDNGFDSQTFFSHTKKGAEYYAKQKNKDGIVIEIKADARDIEFAAGGAEFYSPYRLVNNNGVWQSDNVRTPPERSFRVSIDDIDIKNEVRGSQSGQMDLELIARLGAGVIGSLQYSEYEGVPHIQMIETAAEYKRQGVATALLRELQSLYPNTGIEVGMSTDDGTKLLEAISYRVDNEEYIRLNNELTSLTEEQKEIELSLSMYYDLPADEVINDYNDNVLTDNDISVQGDRWNTIHDRIYEIEQSMRDMKPYHTFIRTGSEENIVVDNPLSQQQESFFSNSKIRDENGNLIKMYHGTPYANYASFHAGTHFTPSKEYADRYHSPSAGSASRTDTLNPSTIEVFLNITKPFDTRNQLERDIFYNEYLGKYSVSNAPLMDSGLADWTEAENLQEFLIENGYDYDGLVLSEGGVSGYDDVIERGLTYVCFYPNQAKLTHNLSPTLDDSFSDSRLDNERALSQQQAEYFSNSVVRNEDGSLIVLYHGTGTEIAQFDTQYTGQGNDQYGSGFYFTTDYNTASGYTTATLTGNDNKPIDKLGGTDNPNVLNVYINLANPIIIDGMEQANLSDVRVTDRQARDIIRRLPSLYHDRGNEDKPNPLGDYLEQFWTAPLNTRRDYERLIDVAAREFFTDTDLLTLDGLFAEYPTEFRQAVRDVCGYDGVIVNFESSKHVIAWFPEQIKDVLCKEPALTPLLNDDAALRTAIPSTTYKIHANPRYDGTNSRTFVQAYDIVGNAELIPRDILYMGTPDNAISVVNALINGDITPDEARTRWDNETVRVEITNRAFDDEGYLHFTAETDGYSLDGLFRVYDPPNGNDLSIVSIDYGDRHPIIAEKWSIIEAELREYSAARYAELTHGDNEEKEIKEMPDNLLPLPIGEIARLDYVLNPSTDALTATSGSPMLEAALASVPQDEHADIYSRYRNAYLDANASGQFPKIAILQLREGEENHYRRFESMASLEQHLQETPNCDNYEVVYIRTVAEPTETEVARETEAEKLFTEFNANTLRPRDYYGHSMSVSDIVVFSNDTNEQHAYFVDSGFEKLPDDFLSRSMIAKIQSGAVIEHEASLLQHVTAYQAENAVQLTDSSVTDRHFQISSQYARIFEMAARRGTIMDMDALGYEPAQVDGFSDDFLMFKEKGSAAGEEFGYDGWEAVNDFIHDVRTLHESYTVQELQDRANGDYGTIEYGTFGDRAVQTAIAVYSQDRPPVAVYRRQVQAIYDYEVANNIPENDRMTNLSEANLVYAKAFYKENDPSVMDRAVSDRRIGISDASIAARYAEIHAERTSPERSSSLTVDFPTLDYIHISDTQTGWSDNGDKDYGYVDGYLRGYNVEFRNRETGAIDYSSAIYVDTTVEQYYQSRINEWGNVGYEPFEAENRNGFEPTGRAVFRGYVTEHYDADERDTFFEDAGDSIERLMNERRYQLKADIDPHKSIIDNVEIRERSAENMLEAANKLIADGVTLAEISEELNYRDNAPQGRWDDNLFEYTTEELQEIENILDRRREYLKKDLIDRYLLSEPFLNVGSAENQDNAYVSAEEYLSGDIEAKLALARAALPLLPSVERNVQALEIAAQIERGEQSALIYNRGRDNISVSGHTGTWYVVDNDTIDGKRLFLLESEQHGDEAAALIIDENINLILDDVWNGFDDYREQVDPLQDRLNAIFDYELLYGGASNADSITEYDHDLDRVILKPEIIRNNSEGELQNILDIALGKANEDREEHAERPSPERPIVENVTDEHIRRIAAIVALNTQHNSNALETELTAREIQNADLPIDARFRDYTIDELREAAEFVKNYTPIPNRYYEPALDLDGTADELYTQARNGYIENPDALHRLGEILTQEGKADEAERVGYMEEREREDTSLYSVAEMKLDFMDAYGGIDDVAISDTSRLSVSYEPRDNNVIVSLSQTWQDGNEDVYSRGANVIPLDEFKGMSRADFDRFVGEVSAYSMIEEERTPREPIQELTHGDNENVVTPFLYTAIQNESTRRTFTYNDTLNNYNVTREQLLSVGASRSFDTMSVDEAVKELADLKSKGFLEFRNAREVSWYATTENNTPYEEKWEIENGFLIPIESHSVGVIVIDGHNCVRVDEWTDSTATYTLGQATEDNTFYYAQVDDEESGFLGVYTYEYDNMPSHETVEGDHANTIANMALDRHEAENGADGRRAFPHLNDEPPRDYREAVTLIEGMSDTQIANMGHDEASNLMSLLDREWLTIENIIDDVMEDGYDEIYTAEYVQQLGYDNDYFRQLSGYVEELAIGQYMRGELRVGERPVRQIVVPQKEVVNSVELDRIVAAVAAPVEIDSSLPPKDQLKQTLENGVRSVIDSEQFKSWLSTGGKLFYNNYSFRNAMLVWLQKPEATYVMGYEKWKEFGRNVGQGAQGAKILIPLMASEKFKGGLFRSIKNNLNEQLSKDPSLTEATYRLGSSNLDFTMNRANHLIGFKSNGIEQQIFGSDDEAKRFIDRAIIGKVPTGFTVGTVFDAQDVIIPDYLWVKQGFTKDEIAPDDKGNPIKNKRGETKILNTPERQARFQTDLDTSIAAKDPVKMQALFDACVSVSEKKGVPVRLEDIEGETKGYFKREFNEATPNGYIAIKNDLEITEKCAVLFHEMGHADLHKNIEALAKSMGEEKIPREMREVQAEAVAFATSSTFGIVTDTSTFNYLAVYSRGFELQDFQKSLDLIYKETQALTKDIKAELDIRGLNLDLTEKPKELLSKETLVTLSANYMDFAVENGSKIQAAINELPSLVKQSAGNTDLMDILKYQKQNLDSQKADVDTMLDTVESLNTAVTREAQDEAVSTLDSAQNRVSDNANALEVLSDRYVVVSEQARGGLKVDFEKNPRETLEAMKKDFPALSKLSEPQLQYLSTSKFVSREFVKLLRDNPQEFVNKVTERAALLPKVASKNGTFVEISFCEQWTDKPFFENGTLCSPKIANVTVTGCEAQAKGFRVEAEKRGEYFPYTKCEVSVFTPSKDGNMVSLNTRVDIGGSGQTNLKDHLGEICQRGAERKEVLANFTEALSERADKRKIVVQDLSLTPQTDETPDKAIEKEGNKTHEAWGEQIKEAKDKAAAELKEKAAEKAQSKNKHDRT